MWLRIIVFLASVQSSSQHDLKRRHRSSQSEENKSAKKSGSSSSSTSNSNGLKTVGSSSSVSGFVSSSNLRAEFNFVPQDPGWARLPAAEHQVPDHEPVPRQLQHQLGLGAAGRPDQRHGHGGDSKQTSAAQLCNRGRSSNSKW